MDKENELVFDSGAPLASKSPLERASHEYRERGYSIIRNVIPASYFDNLAEALLNLCVRFSPAEFKSIRAENIIFNPEFHRLLIKLRAENPQAGGRIYDSLQCSVAIAQMALYPNLLSIVSCLLKQPVVNLNNYIHLLRIDTPGDQRNNLGWHNDSVTTEKTVTCYEGLVAWIPLHDVSAELGSIDVCVGSHREGANNIVRPRDGGNTSEYLEYPQEIIDKYEKVSVSAKRGDVVVMPFHTIHRSGFNSSDRIRFTMISRYYSMVAPDFTPGRNKYVLSA